MLFFGVVPVNLTYFVMSGEWSVDVFLGSLSAGLMGANVLLVNNYRDADADSLVGKRTLAVIFGRNVASALYLINGLVAVALMACVWIHISLWAMLAPMCYIAVHIMLWLRIRKLSVAALNPMLGVTAMLMLAYSVVFAALA